MATYVGLGSQCVFFRAKYDHTERYWEILRDTGSKLTIINIMLSSLLELKDTTFFPTCVDTFNFRDVLPFNIV